MAETLTALEYNGETGKTIERELSTEEIADLKLMKKEADKIESERKAKILARESALAKLAALGLTEEEIGAL
jgi:DNA-binding NarL/FixJ family response regulator